MKTVKFTRSSGHVDHIDAELVNIKWTDSYPFYFENGESFVGMSGKPGLYRFTYKPKNEIVYVGESSNVTSRVGSHRAGFNESGWGPGGHKLSTVCRKMFNFDPDPNNWTIELLIAETKEQAKQLESYWYYEFTPRFNTESRLATYARQFKKPKEQNSMKTTEPTSNVANIAKAMVFLLNHKHATSAVDMFTQLHSDTEVAISTTVSSKVNSNISRSAERRNLIRLERKDKAVKLGQKIDGRLAQTDPNIIPIRSLYKHFWGRSEDEVNDVIESKSVRFTENINGRYHWFIDKSVYLQNSKLKSLDF